MRTPSDRVALYQFWIDSLKILLEHHCESLKEAKRRGLEVPHIPETPQCGFFRTRLVRNGPWVVARVYLSQPVDRRGNLVGDEVLRCEIAGVDYDPEAKWLWLADRPISSAEYRFGVGHRKWSEDNRIHVPRADQPVDWERAPSPTFRKKKGPKHGNPSTKRRRAARS